MIKASVCKISFAFRPWLRTACMLLLIIILHHNDGDHVVQAEGAAEPPTASDGGSIFNQAIGGFAPGVTSIIAFNRTSILSCDTKEKTPGYLTTVFLVNSQYAFGCLSNVNSSYYFSVTLTGANFPNTPVWLANRYHPVKGNASLSVTPQGSLLLQDSDGTHVWSGAQSNTGRSPAGLRLTAEGNLIFFDDQNTSLWESFLEPVDLLVPGQFLNPGGMLVAGFSSPAGQTGSFIAVMKPGGLIFYENSTSKPLPYYALGYPPTNINGIMSSPCNHTQLQLNSTNLTQVQMPHTPACTAAGAVISFGSPVVFIRLESNGLLKGYYPDHKQAYDLFQNNSKGLCGIPNACGPYGICNESACVCPENQSGGEHFTLSSTQDYLLTSDSCTPKTPLRICQGSGLEDYHFLDLTEVDYFANDYIDATLSTENFTACKAACAANCSCQAAFYRMESKECYLHESVMSMIDVENDDYVGSIKLQKERSRRTMKPEMKLIIGIGIACLVSIVFFGVWFYHHKRKRGKHRALTQDEDDLLASLPGQAKRFSFKELQAATCEFREKLGVGGFGSVYKGILPDGTNVAVKQLENTTRFTQGMKEFRNEVITLSNINHQNLVHLRGFCADGGHRLLVYEYVPNGSLDVWLFRKGAERPGPPLDWKTRLAIAVHTARGLVFLHEQCRNCIVHLDIKPQNILLDEQFVPKLSDFGLSRLINEDQDSAVSRMRGTPGYMAPECLILTDATEKSDVYSFGMVLLEIVSGRKNVDVSRLVVHGDGEGWYFPAMAARKFKEGNVVDIIDKSLGQLGSEGMAEATRVIKIAFWCIQDNPSIRPTMGKTLLMLEGYSKVRKPPLSHNFGMRFRLSSSISTNSCTPRHGTPHNVSSPKKGLQNGDHQNESEANTKDLKNQVGRGTPPLSSHQASPRTSPVLPFSTDRSNPSSDIYQASPRHSPSSNTPRGSPFSPYGPSSPQHTSPLLSSPLSHCSPAPFHDAVFHSRQPSSTSPPYMSPVSSPRHV